MAVFYRKYRPQKFSDLIGQEHIVSTLFSQITSGKIGHGYLFSGPKGSGKTSTARIFAKAVNCLVFGKDAKKRNIKFGEPCNKCLSCLSVVDGSHLDLVEIDAASNRSIEDIRDLREKIKLSPVSSRFKVYIIDEVHMLTREAHNALLKTLEEPPAHAIFILCTTEPAKLPATIISRVQRFSFSRASKEELGRVIAKVAKSEGIKLEDEASKVIIKASDGSFRDAVSILDQLSAYKKVIKAEVVKKVSIISDWNQLYDFVNNLVNNNLKDAVLIIEKNWQNGIDQSFFAKEIILFLEKMLFVKIGIEESYLELDKVQLKAIRELSLRISSTGVQYLIKLFLIAEGEMKVYPLPHIPLVLAACKFVPESKGDSDFEVNSKDKNVAQSNSSASKIVNDKKDINKKTSKKASSNLAQIQTYWKKFLDEVRLQNTHIMAILRSVRPMDFDGENLTLEVYYRFHKEKLEEPKIIMMLEEKLKDITSQQVRIRFSLIKKEAQAPEPVKSSDVVDVESKEFERMAQEIFTK